MRTKIGLEIEAFWTVKGKVCCPPGGESRDGSMALLEERTPPCEDKYTLFIETIKAVERLLDVQKRHKGKVLFSDRAQMSREEYNLCLKQIAKSGGKEIHAADAIPVAGNMVYRISSLDEAAGVWNLWAALHVNVSRVVVASVERTCDKCLLSKTQDASESVLSSAWLKEYYNVLQPIMGDSSARMIRVKRFLDGCVGAELRSIPSFVGVPSLKELFRLCGLLFTFPKDDLIKEDSKGD